MLRYQDLEEFTDGKRYTREDTASLDTGGCRGCSRCCESDMGQSLILDPWDIFYMTKGTGKSFDELLTGFYVELGMADGLILPHIKMDGVVTGCRFLNKEKRCSIHSVRPSVCRLFPLGRLYEGNGFSYILQKDECAVQKRGNRVIREWIGIEPLEEHEDFIRRWHRFLGLQKKRVREASPELAKELSKALLRVFYMDPWQEGDFYPQFEKRMRLAMQSFRQLSEQERKRAHREWMEKNGEDIRRVVQEMKEE